MITPRTTSQQAETAPNPGPAEASRPLRGYDGEALAGYRCRVATDLAARMRAWRLAYRTYRGKGYATFRESGLWCGPHDVLDGTTTFLIEGAEGDLGTFTVVPDTHELGLPADQLYPDRLAGLRASGRRLGELVSLVNSVGGRSGQAVLRQMFRYVYLTSRCLDGATDLVITVNPRHRAYYERVLCFECIGEERDYDKVQGAPAVLLRLDYETMIERYAEAFAGSAPSRDLYRFFYGPDGYDEIAWIAAARRRTDHAALREWFAGEVRGCA